MLHFLKRFIWIVFIGCMIALHNTWNQEVKSLDDVRTELSEKKKK